MTCQYLLAYLILNHVWKALNKNKTPYTKKVIVKCTILTITTCPGSLYIHTFYIYVTNFMLKQKELQIKCITSFLYILLFNIQLQVLYS